MHDLHDPRPRPTPADPPTVRLDAEAVAVFEGPHARAVRGLMVEYRCGIEEIVTKIVNLQQEFTHLHEYNPIESISSRLKTPASLAAKLERKGLERDLATIRRSITDVAGVRVVCSFVADVYRVFDLLAEQPDVRVVEVRDYIASPKPNGYRSLHGLVEVPVYLSSGEVPVLVEVQVRTIAMDFWASLEHKIFYKYHREVPATMTESLLGAAETAAGLDVTMETLRRQMSGGEGTPPG